MLGPGRTRTAHSSAPGFPPSSDDIALEAIQLQETQHCKQHSNTEKGKPIAKGNHHHLALRLIYYHPGFNVFSSSKSTWELGNYNLYEIYEFINTTSKKGSTIRGTFTGRRTDRDHLPCER